jgi:hypothetical protein
LLLSFLQDKRTIGKTANMVRMRFIN